MGKVFGGCLAALFLIAAGTATPARADVIDQQNTSSTGTLSNPATNPSLGQSFTPTLALIDFASFVLASDVATTFRVDLYDGAGFGGAVLGSSNAQALVVGTVGSEQPVEFDFAAAIGLTPGNIYTLRLVQVSGPGTSHSLIASSSTLNPYAGGNAYVGTTGISLSGTDLVFSEGIRTAAIPEPSAFALASLMAIGGAAATRLRRKSL